MRILGIGDAVTMQPCNYARSAFTLIELMVVIVLIGIMTAMIIPEMKGTYEDALLRSTSRELVNVLNLAYSRAVSLNQPYRVRLEERTGKYFTEKRVRETERGDEFVRLKDVTGSEGELDTRISIRFHKPDDMPLEGQDEAAPSLPSHEGELPSQEAGIAFYPDGTADAGEFLLRDRDGFRLVLQVNPITARVHIVELGRE
jgi:type II secretion system protein H